MEKITMDKTKSKTQHFPNTLK